MKPEDLVYNKKYYLQTSQKSEIVTYTGKKEGLYIFEINLDFIHADILGNVNSIIAKFYFPNSVVESKIIDFDETVNSFEQLDDL
jgi:hypothetical protein